MDESSKKNQLEDSSEKKEEIIYWLILLRSDHSLNELKLSKVLSPLSCWRFANDEEIFQGHFKIFQGSETNLQENQTKS